MTKCVNCGKTVIDSVMPDKCQSCALEQAYFGGSYLTMSREAGYDD